MYQKVKNSYQVKKEYWKQGKDAKATAQALGVSLYTVYRYLDLKGLRNEKTKKKSGNVGKIRVQNRKRRRKSVESASME